MNIEERAAQAAAWKATGQCNCAQAVLKAFEDKLPVDADTLMKLGAGYAAGMGCMESTCGALIGAVMVAGIVTDGKGTPRISKELLQNFQEKCGATICKDLKGIENGAPLCPCPECVRNAVLALGEVLRRRAAKSRMVLVCPDPEGCSDRIMDRIEGSTGCDAKRMKGDYQGRK